MDVCKQAVALLNDAYEALAAARSEGWEILSPETREEVCSMMNRIEEFASCPAVPLRDLTVELEIRQNELYLAMGVVEAMPASEAQTACISKLAQRMRQLVELRGKSEVGRSLDV